MITLPGARKWCEDLIKMKLSQGLRFRTRSHGLASRSSIYHFKKVEIIF